MTFRERLADWISGGALTYHLALRRISEADSGHWLRETDNFALKAHLRAEALSDIAAMETPGANATVKRMAARAREALK